MYKSISKVFVEKIENSMTLKRKIYLLVLIEISVGYVLRIEMKMGYRIMSCSRQSRIRNPEVPSLLDG